MIVERLKWEEGFYPIEYKDSLGYATIGHGTRMPLSKCEIEAIGGFDRSLSKEQAEILLRSRLERLKKRFYKEVPWVLEEPKEVQNILENMLYQLGVSGTLKFKKTLELIKRKDYKGASREMLNSLWAREQTTKRAIRLSLDMRKVRR